MAKGLERLLQSLENLEKAIGDNLSCSAKDQKNSLDQENLALKQELQNLKEDYAKLQETSKEVMEELNSSIKIIENHLKKKNASN
jgi:hypothetical protein